MTGSRLAVLTALDTLPEPATLAVLSSATGLHLNTVRDHLEALEASGDVRRRRASPKGRGRPAWLYESTGASTPTGPQAEYAGLATVLASVIERHSPDPRTEAAEAGRSWGHALAREQVGPARPGAAPARDAVVDLLDDLGYSPKASTAATSVRLTRCPVLDAARTHPDVVCAVHLGIIQGALAEWDEPAQDVRLEPFSEPGACRLLLPTRPTRPQQRGARG